MCLPYFVVLDLPTHKLKKYLFLHSVAYPIVQTQSILNFRILGVGFALDFTLEVNF